MTKNLILVAGPRSGAGLLQEALIHVAGWSSSNLCPVHEWYPSEPFVSDASHPQPSPEHTDQIQRQIAERASPIDQACDVAVDWDPRLSLHVGLLAQALPEAQFVFMVRRPVSAIASLMEAWHSRRFALEEQPPGWWGDPWSFPMIPTWPNLIGKPPAEVCATQWATIVEAALDDLMEMPPDRWTIASYENLLQEPLAELAHVGRALGLEWRGDVLSLPVTASAVSPPNPGKWARNWSEIANQIHIIEPVAGRLRETMASRRPEIEWPHARIPVAQAPGPQSMQSTGTPFASSHTPSMADLLQKAGCSLLITTYKSGHVIIARSSDGTVDTEFTAVSRPMGAAVQGNRLAIGASDSVLSFSISSGLGPKIPANRSVDTPYTPRAIVFTGDVAIHDMSFGGDGELYFVNTRFSCLSRLDLNHSFDPVWRPPWISALAPDDRCHLNGLAIRDGVPRYVSALSRTDTPNGWRALKGTSGVIVDVTTNELIAEGLSMPHSPRWHNDKLWILESGYGSLAVIDIDSGSVTTVAHLPGFTRGLSFLGPYALIGLSQVRESVFAELPITASSDERNCGVWVVDTRDGETAGFLKFHGAVQEIFDVQVLPGRWPSVVQPGNLTRNAFVVSDTVLREFISNEFESVDN